MSDFVLADGYEIVSRLRVPWRVAYCADNRVFVHDLNTDRRTAILGGAGGTACPLAWSADGKSVLRSVGNAVEAIDVRRKKSVTLFRSQGRVTWFLSCSPDGNEVLYLDHARGKRQARIFDLRTRTKWLASSEEKAWKIACDWSRRVVIVTTLDAIWRVSLDDGSATCVVDVVRAHDVDAASGLFVYETGRLSPEETITGSIWLRSFDGKILELVSNDGRQASLSPDAKTIAYMRHEDQLLVYDIATRNTVRVMHAVRANAQRRGSYATQPLWSPDGRYLLFRTTISERSDTLPARHEAFVAEMQRLAAAAKKRRARTGARPRMDYAGSIEHAYWSHRFFTGILDLHERRIQLREEYWNDAAWCPVQGKISRSL